MEGVNTFQTMMVTTHHGKRTLHLLLDSGSTHNFINRSVAAKLNCKVETISLMLVKVADGGQIRCDAIIKVSSGKCKGNHFKPTYYFL